MDKKIEEAREFLQTIGMPKAQQADICCYVILAMAGIKPDMSWSEGTNEWIRIHDIIQFVNTFYGTSYAENSRETFRKQALHRFRTAALVEDNGKATNSPNYRYRLTEETIKILRTMETSAWKESIKRFLCYHEKLIDLYASKKKMTMMPVNINGENFKFSAGKHNELQKAIIEEFAPRFAPNSECLYVGDTIEKDLVKNVEKLKELGFEITLHDKMPDVVLYREDKDWIYFVESVTSVGPMDPKRILEIEEMTKDVTAGKIFVSFDFENDRSYKYTLNMWNANSNFEFTCNDKSPSEIQSWNIPTVKAVLSRKINEATHIVVIVGKEANKLHKDRMLIGYRNWQNFEVAKAKELGKHIIAVQLNSLYEYPEELKNCGAKRVYSFNHDDIVSAIRGW